MLRSLTAVTSPYFLLMWSSVTPAIVRFSFPPSLGRCKGVLARAEIDSRSEDSGARGRQQSDSYPFPGLYGELWCVLPDWLAWVWLCDGSHRARLWRATV